MRFQVWPKVFERLYRFNGMKTRLGTTLLIENIKIISVDEEEAKKWQIIFIKMLLPNWKLAVSNDVLWIPSQ